MTHLLLISIGPVQDFIASARKAQDLWFGSWLLSDLSATVAQMFPSPATVVFPGNLEDENVANKILVQVTEDPRAEAEKARAALKKRLMQLATDLFARASEKAGDLAQHFDMAVALKQVEDLIEFLWVAVPLGDNYAEARKQAETALAARKNTKTWGAVTWGAPVPKSALDGQRESVLREDLFDQINGNPSLGEKARRAFGIRPTERLCGVGLLKRLGQEVGDDDGAEHGFESKTFGTRRRPTFHSTSHSAALQLIEPFESSLAAHDAFALFREQLENEQFLGTEGVKRFRLRSRSEADEVTSFAYYDGSLLFEERLRLALEERMDRTQARERLKALRDFRVGVLKACGVSEPPPYYVLLLADGDRMGAAIDAQDTLQKHQELSSALEAFAKQVKEIVRENDGSLIYAGGDDVLALLPLHTAVACARELADEFAKLLSRFPAADESKPTLSVGLAVAHHLTHFALVRDQAKRAEKAAKKTRNALAISIDKRSGGETVIAGSWTGNVGIDAIDSRLLRWVRLFHDSEMPHGMLHDLEELAALGDGGGPAMTPMLVTEASRVLLRKQPGQGARDLKRSVRDELTTRIKAAPSASEGLRELANELYVALELHRSMTVAWPAKKLTKKLADLDPWETPGPSMMQEPA